MLVSANFLLLDLAGGEVRESWLKSPLQQKVGEGEENWSELAISYEY
jgi:hypothetical protein